MTNPADQVLVALLASYERRKNPTERAISVPVTTVQGYFDQKDPTISYAVNRQLEQWEAMGWVNLRWERGETGNLLNRIVLTVKSVSEIYAYLGRTPAYDQQNDLRRLLEDFQPQVGADFAPVIEKVIADLNAGYPIGPFKLDDPERNEALLKVLAALSTLTEELPERIFSSQVLGDSKYLTRLKSSLLILIRRTYPHLASSRPEEVWAALGILPNPGHVYVRGPLRFELKGHIINVNIFQPDLGIPVHSIPDLNILSLTAPYILTIENQTSFYDFVDKMSDEGLIVYLGGFPNRARRKLLQELIAFSPNTPLYHWGDMDYGGFSILSYLRRFLNHPVLTYQMDVSTLKACSRARKKLTTTDRRNLTRLLADEYLQDVQPVIEQILSTGFKWEQENLNICPLLPQQDNGNVQLKTEMRQNVA